MLFDVSFIKEFFWDKMFLFKEPDEDETGNETDATLVVELVIICVSCKVVRETGHLHCPGIPVTKFGVELLGEQVAGEHFHPMLVQFLIVRIGLVTNRGQYVNVPPMGIQAVDAA